MYQPRALSGMQFAVAHDGREKTIERGGSRGFLDQTEARTAEKKNFGDRPPLPYLRVWVCILLTAMINKAEIVR